MKRISISNSNGSWFDRDSAELFEEATFFDGRNYISKATGYPFYHESLYLTKSQKWVLYSWSNYQGASFSNVLIDSEAAARWFANQGYDEKLIPDDLISMVNSFEI